MKDKIEDVDIMTWLIYFWPIIKSTTFTTTSQTLKLLFLSKTLYIKKDWISCYANCNQVNHKQHLLLIYRFYFYLGTCVYVIFFDVFLPPPQTWNMYCFYIQAVICECFLKFNYVVYAGDGFWHHRFIQYPVPTVGHWLPLHNSNIWPSSLSARNLSAFHVQTAPCHAIYVYSAAVKIIHCSLPGKASLFSYSWLQYASNAANH